jgi:steroid delta-isomerase-like uncharacterized protein
LRSARYLANAGGTTDPRNISDLVIRLRLNAEHLGHLRSDTEALLSETRDVVERFFDLFAAGKIAETRELFAPECITVMPGGSLDIDQHEAMGHAFRAAFPDSRMAVDHTVETDDEIVVLGHFIGTNSGDFVGPDGTIPASGKPLTLRFMDYFKVEDGRIVDHRTVFDQLDLLRQIGAMP